MHHCLNKRRSNTYENSTPHEQETKQEKLQKRPANPSKEPKTNIPKGWRQTLTLKSKK